MNQINERFELAQLAVDGARRKLQLLRTNLSQRKQEVLDRFAPLIQRESAAVTTARNRLLNFADMYAVRHGKAVTYLSQYPERADSTANAYARANETNPQSLQSFKSFFDSTVVTRARGNLRLSTLSNRYGPWVNEDRSPTPQEYKKIPSDIQGSWVQHLRREALFLWGIEKRPV